MMGGESAIRALVVDDESGIRQAVARVLRNAGLEALTAESGEDALALLQKEPIDVAVLDIRMPGLTGIDVLRNLKEQQHPAEVVMMTAHADAQLHLDLAKQGAYALVTKPFQANEAIIIKVVNAATHKRLRERSQRLQEQLADRSIAGTVTSLSLHELAFAEAKKRVVTEFTNAYVAALLEATNNNVSEAARRSGLDRSNFRRLLKKPA
jgi:DNA-binding NtrC family response regulator